MNVDTFVEKTLVLIDKEREAEIEESRILIEKLPARELQRRGVCLLKLHIGGQKSGMYGRTVVSFEPYWAGNELPSNNFSPGDIIGLSLSEGQSESISSGIVAKITQSSISIAFDESLDTLALNEDSKYKLTKLANDVTYKRLKRALHDLRSCVSGPACSLVNVLFGLTQPGPPTKHQALSFVNTALDDSQKEAVSFALHQREIAVIHGPPGTGKTTTVVEIILQAVKQGSKILACAPSNIAVDNLVERLANEKQRIVRLGHPARLLPEIQRYSLDAILMHSDDTQIVQDVRRDMDKTLSMLRKTRHKGERQSMREELKYLRRELRQREDTAIQEVLKRADIVLVTLTSAVDRGPLKHLTEKHFDLVIIDECSQALEAACWLALLRAPKCVLAGDHKQLPPTILSQEAANSGLDLTLMERVLDLHGDSVVRMLTTQYRMHEDIMSWSSRQLYDDKLLAHSSVKSHLLRDLAHIDASSELAGVPLVLIDTAGCDVKELDLPEEISKGNEGEADIVAAYVHELVTLGLDPADIAVIAPYNLQVELLRIRLSSKFPRLEIKSVDGFQGREKEAVVISMVRSNDIGEVGFLSENRRMNVAVTRARRHLAIICDTETVSHDDFLNSLITHMTSKGEVHSALEYLCNNQPDFERPEIISDLLATRQHQHGSKQSRSTKFKESSGQGAKPKHYRNIKVNADDDKRSIHNEPVLGEKKSTYHKTDNRKRVEGPLDAELKATVAKFVADAGTKTYEFPTSLSARERALVHEAAEELGLFHGSQGDGDKRFIILQQNKHKPKSAQNVGAPSLPASMEIQTELSNDRNRTTEILDNKIKSSDKVDDDDVDYDGEDSEYDNVDRDSHDIVDDKEGCEDNDDSVVVKDEKSKLLRIEAVTKPEIMRTCELCGRKVIVTNLLLHDLHCKGQQRASNTESKQNTGNQSAKSRKKRNKKSVNITIGGNSLVNANTALEKADPDDFDAIIAAANKDNKKCVFKKCKIFSLTVGLMCQFCNLRFCMSHFMPETHGCGEAVKVHARRVFIQEGILHRGTGVPNRKPSAEKRAVLQRQLDKKLNDLSQKRKSIKEGKK